MPFPRRSTLALCLLLIDLNHAWRFASLRLPSEAPCINVAGSFATLALGAAIAVSAPASADTGLGYVDNAGAASYSQVQRAWEKSATMTERERMLAMRGASKPADLAAESPKSQKRRAMAGCKDDIYRAASGYKDEASCNARVLGGDVNFMLEVMEAE